jgi:aldehyde dehydrogenase (NAD+)
MENYVMSTIPAIFASLSSTIPLDARQGMMVTSPLDGAVIASIDEDSVSRLEDKIAQAVLVQKTWSTQPRAVREQVLEKFAAAIKAHREALAHIIVLEAGKTLKEALGEVDSSADVLLKTIKDAALPDVGGMKRVKERPAVGVVGLITSFNFPIAVACWTIAPALLAGNAVLWKPSEKTPLTALAVKAIFDQVAGTHAGLIHSIIGGREIGAAMVAHERVDMISATGSVGMGKGIKAALAKKDNHSIKPILELGGNNGVIISQHFSPEKLEWAVIALISSFLGTSGQRCTNTRRLIVHQSHYDRVILLFETQLQAMSPEKMAETFGYGPLIDADAFARFEQAKKAVEAQGGTIRMGKRLRAAQYPNAYYVEPALAGLPKQTDIMFEETFAPILFITPYDGDIISAMTLLNAPDNAGLVAGIYTQSRTEVEVFSLHVQAGHGVINSPKGTGTPAYAMGFGGNKASGEGEILNSADPLCPFTRRDGYRRIAQNTEIALDLD